MTGLHLFAAAAMLTMAAGEAHQAPRVSQRAVKYEFFGCSDEGAEVRARFAGSRFSSWNADVYGSLRVMRVRLVSMPSGYRLSVVSTYGDGSRVSYSTMVDIDGSRIAPRGMLHGDARRQPEDDLKGMEYLYRISLDAAAAGKVTGTFECH
jgi:hypothetical protein